jgi:hypothetical protein
MGPQVFEKSISCVNNLRLQANRKIVSDHINLRGGHPGRRELGLVQGRAAENQSRILLSALPVKASNFGWVASPNALSGMRQCGEVVEVSISRK